MSTTHATMTMTDDAAVLRLLSWFSPAFPTGGFAYSGGLESAVRDGLVADTTSLREWIESSLNHGAAWNDAVLFAESWRCARDGCDLEAIAELALALAGSQSRLDEISATGRSFRQAVDHWPGIARQGEPAISDWPWPVASGAACGRAGIALETALAAFLQAFVSNQLQAAIRLGLLGQSEATRLLGELEPAVAAAGRAAAVSLDDLGGCAILAEIAAMRHEALESRLFRS
jgi:urease accessory protein